jgi:hypothetical protein
MPEWIRHCIHVVGHMRLCRLVRSERSSVVGNLNPETSAASHRSAPRLSFAVTEFGGLADS